jgi:hypothetical protein
MVVSGKLTRRKEYHGVLNDGDGLFSYTSHYIQWWITDSNWAK